MSAARKKSKAPPAPLFDGVPGAMPAPEPEKISSPVEPLCTKPAVKYDWPGQWRMLHASFPGCCSNPLCKGGKPGMPRRILKGDIIYYSATAKRTLCAACGDQGCNPTHVSYSDEIAILREFEYTDLYRPRYVDMEMFYLKNPGEREKWERSD